MPSQGPQNLLPQRGGGGGVGGLGVQHLHAYQSKSVYERWHGLVFIKDFSPFSHWV